MNIQVTPLPTYPATAVAEALALIATGDVPVIDLEPGDVLWQDVPVSCWRPLEAVVGEYVRVAPLFGVDGRPVDQPSGDWWDAALLAHEPRAVSYWQNTPNAAINLGGFLAVSWGPYIAAGVHEVDGVRLVELVKPMEASRRNSESFLARHPDVAAAKPGWADSVAVDADTNADAEVWFERNIGPVRLSRHAEFNGGVLRWDDDTTAPSVDIDDGQEMTVAQMRELASALMVAIPIVEEATA